MVCYMCEYDGSCQLQEIAPDITGCSGHSKYKEPPEKPELYVVEQSQQSRPVVPKLSDFKVGDCVIADSNPHNLRMWKLPGYLAGNALTVIGFTKEKVICDWDGGKPFRILPELLRICKREGGSHADS